MSLENLYVSQEWQLVLEITAYVLYLLIIATGVTVIVLLLIKLAKTKHMREEYLRSLNGIEKKAILEYNAIEYRIFKKRK